MVDVVQLVRASDCGSECRGFESHLPPRMIPVNRKIYGDFSYYQFSSHAIRRFSLFLLTAHSKIRKTQRAIRLKTKTRARGIYRTRPKAQSKISSDSVSVRLKIAPPQPMGAADCFLIFSYACSIMLVNLFHDASKLLSYSLAAFLISSNESFLLQEQFIF